MNTQILVTCFFAIVAFAPRVPAQSSSQVDYNAGLGQRTVHTLTGPVADDNAVWIGAFDTGFDVAGNADDPAALLAHWNHYGDTTINTLPPPFSQQGSFSGSSTSTSTVFNNLKIYLWIFSTDGQASPTADFSNVNEYGVFSSTDPEWIFPSPTAPFPGNTRDVNSDDVNQWYYGNVDATRLILSPISPVPEPSTLGLLCLAVPTLVLVLRKRRR
jgi:hypothetical protein